MTDDEKCQKLMEFSPRRQKPREIINVKELQSDFVGNIHIKKEIEESKKSDVIQEVFDGGNIEHAVDGNVCKVCIFDRRVNKAYIFITFS